MPSAGSGRGRKPGPAAGGGGNGVGQVRVLEIEYQRHPPGVARDEDQIEGATLTQAPGGVEAGERGQVEMVRPRVGQQLRVVEVRARVITGPRWHCPPVYQGTGQPVRRGPVVVHGFFSHSPGPPALCTLTASLQPSKGLVRNLLRNEYLETSAPGARDAPSDVRLCDIE